ncbi:hypothetical protein MMC13_002768 [Lambiella insularis]|nr:hypothetical protein [Lambiella insularis]
MTRITTATLFLTVLALSQFTLGQAQESLYAREAADGSELAARNFWKTMDKIANDAGKIGKQAIGTFPGPKRDLEAREAALDAYFAAGLAARGIDADMLEARDPAARNKAAAFFKGVAKVGKGFLGLRRDLGERDLDDGLYERDFDGFEERDLEFEERDLEDSLYERDLDDTLFERDFDGFEERDLEDFE